MFQETKAGQTHSFGDGCGEPEHNTPDKLEKEKEEERERIISKIDTLNTHFR